MKKYDLKIGVVNLPGEDVIRCGFCGTTVSVKYTVIGNMVNCNKVDRAIVKNCCNGCALKIIEMTSNTRM